MHSDRPLIEARTEVIGGVMNAEGRGPARLDVAMFRWTF